MPTISFSLYQVDGRTRAGRLARAMRVELTALVGGAPTSHQLILIERAIAE
jgi:hypothetical protein